MGSKTLKKITKNPFKAAVDLTNKIVDPLDVRGQAKQGIQDVTGRTAQKMAERQADESARVAGIKTAEYAGGLGQAIMGKGTRSTRRASLRNSLLGGRSTLG